MLVGPAAVMVCDEVEMKKHSGMNTFSFVIGRHSIFVTWEESGLHFSFVGVIHHIIIQLLTDWREEDDFRREILGSRKFLEARSCCYLFREYFYKCIM